MLGELFRKASESAANKLTSTSIAAGTPMVICVFLNPQLVIRMRNSPGFFSETSETFGFPRQIAQTGNPPDRRALRIRVISQEISCGYWSRTYLQLVQNACDDSRMRLSIVANYGLLGLEVYLGNFGVEGKGDSKDEGKRE